MIDNFFENTRHSTLVLILIVISFFLLMFGNDIISLTHPDEVFYIQTAKEMVSYIKWFTPMIFDDIQFEKPFVSFMLFAAGWKWSGEAPSLRHQLHRLLCGGRLQVSGGFGLSGEEEWRAFDDYGCQRRAVAQSRSGLCRFI